MHFRRRAISLSAPILFACALCGANSWAQTGLPPLKVDPRLLGLPPLEPLPGAASGVQAETPASVSPATSAADTRATAPAAPTAIPSAATPPAAAPSAPAGKTAAPAPSLTQSGNAASSAPLAPAAQTAPPVTGVTPGTGALTSTPPTAAAPSGVAAGPDITPIPTPPTATDDASFQLQMSAALARDKGRAAEDTPTYISAQGIQGEKDRYVNAEGEVELRKPDVKVNADKLRYDQVEDTLDAQGKVRLQTSAGVLKGPDLHLKLSDKTGSMNTPQYAVAAEEAHGDAAKLTLLGENHYDMKDARYSTCAVGKEDWWLRATDMDINRSTNVGVGYNTWIDFEGLPILYTPYISFPLHKQRKSGLLTPTFGTTGNSGFEASLPYYWNIAPNYDATFTPRVMTKRGLQLTTEFRYLQPNYAGEVQGEWLPHDAITQTTRSAYRILHNQNFGAGFSGYLNVQKVSDNDYFRDLSSLVSVTSQSTLLREGGLNYANGPWSAAARIQRYQTLQDPLNPIVPPYERVPQLTAAYTKLNVFDFADVRAATEYVKFEHPTMTQGSRFTMNPAFSVPFTNAYGYITPKLGWHYTNYQLDKSTTTLPDSTRSLPIFSLDSGITFERPTSLFNQAVIQTLEPRIYYLYVPFKDQSQIPNFDSGEADFNFAQIFSENRFTGGDRISDANQITLALTSRFLESATGQERLRAAIAQRYFFRTPQVTLTSPAPSDKISDFLASVGGQISPDWSVDTAWQYNPNISHSEKFNTGARYNPEPGKVANFTYRFNRNTLRQFDVSGQWPIASKWQLVGRWNYSLQDRKSLESLGGFEYQAGCWAVRVVAHRFQTATQKTTDAIFVQLELSGLAGLGTNPLTVLKQNIGGYTQSKPQTADINLDDF